MNLIIVKKRRNVNLDSENADKRNAIEDEEHADSIITSFIRNRLNAEGMIEIVKSLARDAGNKILELYNSDFKVEYKDDNSPLTEADRASNDLIVKRLKEDFPNIAILSEEEKDDGERLEKDFCWIIDPLDGTKEFIKKNDEFTVNIALSFKGKPILGVIYVPVLDEMYWAFEGKGAYSNESERIHVSKKLKDLVLVESRSHKSEKSDRLISDNKAKIKKLVAYGSSLKGCIIAKGGADAYFRFGPTMEWDTAAMQCIVEEAGGVFRQMDDSEMTYNRVNNLNEKGFYIINRKENRLRFKQE